MITSHDLLVAWDAILEDFARALDVTRSICPGVTFVVDPICDQFRRETHVPLKSALLIITTRDIEQRLAAAFDLRAYVIFPKDEASLAKFFAVQELALWRQAEETLENMMPDKTTGEDLDRLAGLIGTALSEPRGEWLLETNVGIPYFESDK